MTRKRGCPLDPRIHDEMQRTKKLTVSLNLPSISMDCRVTRPRRGLAMTA
jgi:hypothetical protein